MPHRVNAVDGTFTNEGNALKADCEDKTNEVSSGNDDAKQNNNKSDERLRHGVQYVNYANDTGRSNSLTKEEIKEIRMRYNDLSLRPDTLEQDDLESRRFDSNSSGVEPGVDSDLLIKKKYKSRRMRYRELSLRPETLEKEVQDDLENRMIKKRYNHPIITNDIPDNGGISNDTSSKDHLNESETSDSLQRESTFDAIPVAVAVYVVSKCFRKRN